MMVPVPISYQGVLCSDEIYSNGCKFWTTDSLWHGNERECRDRVPINSEVAPRVQGGLSLWNSVRDGGGQALSYTLQSTLVPESHGWVGC